MNGTTKAAARRSNGRRRTRTIALMLALFINAAILIVAAATFHAHRPHRGRRDRPGLSSCCRRCSASASPRRCSRVALLASGLNSTVTATLAGQIVMEGFLHLRLPNWARRLITRGIAIVPVVIVTALYGERGTGAAAGVQPGHPVDATAVRGDPAGAVRLRPAQDGRVRDLRARSPRWPGSSPAIIVALNVKLLFETFFGLSTAVIARLDRATQYAAALSIHPSCLWNTGSPAFAGDDGRRVATSRPNPAARTALRPSRRPAASLTAPAAAAAGSGPCSPSSWSLRSSSRDRRKAARAGARG